MTLPAPISDSLAEDRPIHSDEQNPTGPRRWWIYQKERFPLLAHSPLVLAFSTSAVCFSWMLRANGAAVVHRTFDGDGSRVVGATADGSHAIAIGPSPAAFVVAFLSCLVFFLQLRIADEFKDFDEDSRYRPYRPVPRGLVTLRELGVVFAIGSVLQLLLALWLEWRLLVLLLITWTYLAGMSKEFFVAHWLRGRHLLYMVSHMAIMPLIDLYATSAEWMSGAGHPPPGLFWFLLASLFNGMAIEIGRKIRRPEDEEEGVATYSVVWGHERAVGAWIAVLALTFVCARFAATKIAFSTPVTIALGTVLSVALVIGALYLSERDGRPRVGGKAFEATSALWTLVLYLGLGLIPYFTRYATHVS